ncbi:filamentous hemagglutinin N-terminal domain-containing protein, partial [Helicobacter pullorum]|uniref:filamentous hemagglutinin N-terminal domain-containing protein n=1 Tax=Helicobacter pullorum TaxID=35818 RepID=UPI0013150584
MSQNLAALPAGGKFIHGSGNISKGNGTMTITGNNKNHVIAWGGGFNINNGETVNFKGSGKAFLNLDYSNKASKILGTLNGGGNNIYLVNPSGVLIGKGVNVNANRFVASTASLDTALTKFVEQANRVGDANAVNFSPVYNRNNLKGSIVNMGTIKANHIILVGQAVRNLASQNENDINGTRGTLNHTGSLKIIGQSIFLDVDGVTNKNNIEVVATNPIDGQTNPDIKIQMSMNTFAKKGHTDNWIAKKYSATGEEFSDGKYYFYNIITIGTTGGWNDFANAWNSGLGITRDIEEFKLIDDLNFNNGDFKSVGKIAGFDKI